MRCGGRTRPTPAFRLSGGCPRSLEARAKTLAKKVIIVLVRTIDMENPAEKCCGWVIVMSHMLAENTTRAVERGGGGVNERRGLAVTHAGGQLKRRKDRERRAA